jgi:HSP20 family molecular chaperone IbpA
LWTPGVDVERDDGHRVIHAELPGIKPEEVKKATVKITPTAS